MKDIIPGMKYETTKDGEIIFYRIVKPSSNTNNAYTVYIDGDTSYKKYTISEEDLLNKCVQIVPDAFVNIMTCNIDGDGTKDVYVCVNRSSDMGADSNVPALILRQNVYSYTKNEVNPMGFDSMWLGECFTSYSTEDIKNYMEIDSIVDQCSVAFYLGDNQDTICRFVSRSMKKKIETTLLIIKRDLTVTNTTAVQWKGFAESLSQLMTDNDFMVGLYGIFNIMYIDFKIDLETNHNDDGDIELNQKQIKRLQDYIGKFIADPIVLKYDRDIDVGEIVSKQHVMVVDPTDIIYLIAFDVIGYYTSGNEDVMQAMGQNV